MGMFDKLKAPIFLKETSSGAQQLVALQSIVNEVIDAQHRKQLEQDIKMISYGLKGEEQIAFELKNSHMPMYILHDLYFEQDGLSAQIDYLIITRKCLFVLECKNLMGDITINQKGDFIRTMRMKEKKNFLTKNLFDKYFYETYQSVVVLANPKTILEDRYAPKDIKNQVVRADQLVEYIRKVNSTAERTTNSDKEMEALGQYFLSKHCDKMMDYSSKYFIHAEVQQEAMKQQEVPVKQDEPQEKVEEQPDMEERNEEEALVIKLKSYRLEQCKKEKIKPYFIFNDKQMRELIEKNPMTTEELLGVSGFGEIKCGKYGEAILEILQQH